MGWVFSDTIFIYDFIYESGWPARSEKAPATRKGAEAWSGVNGIPLVGREFADTINLRVRLAGDKNRGGGACSGAGPPIARFVNEIINEIVSGKSHPTKGILLTISFTNSFTNRADR